MTTDKRWLGLAVLGGSLMFASAASADEAGPVTPASKPAPAAAAPVALAEAGPGPVDQALDADLAGGAGSALTADEVARRAQGSSYDVAAKQAEVAAAQAALDAAVWAFTPKLTAAARYTRLSDPGSPELAPGVTIPVFLNSYSLGGSLQVPLSDYILRMPKAKAAASAGVRAARIGVQSTQLEVATAARELYYNWVRARLQVVIATQALAQGQAHLADAKAAAEVGTASKADVLQVEAQVASAELLVERAKNLQALTEHQLRTTMHDPNGEYRIGEDVRADARVPGGVGDQPALWREAISSRLELRQLREAEAATRAEAGLSKVAYLPRLDAFADASYVNPNQRSFPQKDEFSWNWDAGLQLSWTPSDIPAARANVRRAQAKLAQLEAQRAALEDGLRTQVVAALQSYRQALVAIDTTGRALTAAEEAYRVRRLLFQNGRATSAELTDAETSLTGVRLENLSARIELRVALARLDHVLGRDRATARSK